MQYFFERLAGTPPLDSVSLSRQDPTSTTQPNEEEDTTMSLGDEATDLWRTGHLSDMGKLIPMKYHPQSSDDQHS
jgi:hypothetical protein